MPFRFLQHIDIQMVALNLTSFGSILAWATENATGLAGGFVLITIGILNLAKAYSVYKKADDNDSEKKS